MFWTELASGFEQAGHRVIKIHVCTGDWVFWRKPGALNFRGRFSRWQDYVTDVMRREGVTDVLYFADRVPYHVVAQSVAQSLGIDAYAVEFGYLRPDWLTLERNGMGLYSNFPTDPEVIREAARDLPTPSSKQLYPYTFADEAFGEVTCNLASEILRLFYPFYQSDKYYHPYRDYLAWVLRLAKVKAEVEHANELSEGILASRQSYFMVALQLQSDYQIRANSQYDKLEAMLEEVIESFAYSAARSEQLIIKIHPLDNGIINWRRMITRIATANGVAERVHAINGGNLAKLIDNARGVVVVNSTVGLHALRAGCPTKVLGVAIFDVAGLTHQGTLDSFWTAPAPVDTDLAEAFVRLMAASIQIKGSFYNKAGRAVAVAEMVRRILQGRVNEPGAYVPDLPRRGRAQALGIPVV